MSLRSLFAGLLVARAVATWEFPQQPSVHSGQRPIFVVNDEDVDIVTGSQFNGLKTFANLPYVNCLSDGEALGNKYDVAILGAPFDTVCNHV